MGETPRCGSCRARRSPGSSCSSSGPTRSRAQPAYAAGPARSRRRRLGQELQLDLATLEASPPPPHTHTLRSTREADIDAHGAHCPALESGPATRGGVDVVDPTLVDARTWLAGGVSVVCLRRHSLRSRGRKSDWRPSRGTPLAGTSDLDGDGSARP